MIMTTHMSEKIKRNKDKNMWQQVVKRWQSQVKWLEYKEMIRLFFYLNIKNGDLSKEVYGMRIRLFFLFQRLYRLKYLANID